MLIYYASSLHKIGNAEANEDCVRFMTLMVPDCVSKVRKCEYRYV